MNRPRVLSIDVSDSSDYLEQSYFTNDDTFSKGKVHINEQGINVAGSDRQYKIRYDELEMGNNNIIGRGASSVVILCCHMPTRLPVALKVINLFDKSKREQVIREIVTLYDSTCRSLITFYGAFYRDGAISIALEYMDGGSLANVLAQVGAIPEWVLANMAYQILWGLAYMRVEKKVHRDIKPSNLLINSQGEVKVTDFGVSAELQNSIAMCGTFVGTYKYMSPERIQNGPHSYTSDIWSFGLVMHECATGRYPFQDQVAPIDMATIIIEAHVPPLSEQLYSPEFRAFVGHCILKNPLDRWTAAELLQSDWLRRYNANSFEASIGNIKSWIDHVASGGNAHK